MLDELIPGMDPASFPVVEGFAVAMTHTDSFGYHMSYVDRTGQVVAYFPWWDHADAMMRGWTVTDIPLGPAEDPFVDLEQSWFIAIWQQGDEVFIAQADRDDPPPYDRCSRIPLQDYLDAWTAALARAREDQ